MDKKDIYEHLAKIYLDNSSLKKKKEKTEDKRLFIFIVVAIVLVVGLLFAIPFSRQQRPLNTQTLLVLTTETVKMNYSLDPVKKEVYHFDLKKLNLGRFNTLGFAVKKSNYADTISIRVEVINAFKERSEIYVKDIPSSWKDYKIAFSDFKALTDWTEVTGLSFVIEQWNSQETKGVVYIDNVRFFKQG